MLKSESPLSIFDVILESQLEILSQDIPALASGREPFSRPTVDADILIQLSDYVKDIFASEPTVLDLVSPILVVGDLQGHYHDLLRILKEFGVPTPTHRVRYLFLGNLVGRGEFSLETVTLVYLLKAVYPTQVYVIRGNHEFEVLCRAGGFFKEVFEQCPGSRVFESFMTTFSFTPLAAMIDSMNVCVHAGIGPACPSIGAIRALTRPITCPADPIVKCLVWSNPSLSQPEFAESARNGPLFGEKAVLQFLERSQAVRIIRTHETRDDGFESVFEDRVITVFSASNYLGRAGNEGAVLLVTPDGDDILKNFPPFKQISRKMADGKVQMRRRSGGKISGATSHFSPMAPGQTVRAQMSENCFGRWYGQ
jgi:protein phosphatase